MWFAGFGRCLGPIARPLGALGHDVQTGNVLARGRIIDGAGFHRPRHNQVYSSGPLGIPSIGFIGDGKFFFKVCEDLALPTLAASHVPGTVKGTPLIGKGSHRALPAATFGADQVVSTDHGVSHKHFVEGGMPVHLGQLPHFDPALLHVDDEVGETLMLWRIPVCAGQQQTVLGVVGAGIPDFLTVDDPFVAAQICPGGRSSQIGSAAGLAEQLTPLIFAGQNAPQVLLFLLMDPWANNVTAANILTPAFAQHQRRRTRRRPVRLWQRPGESYPYRSSRQASLVRPNRNRLRVSAR